MPCGSRELRVEQHAVTVTLQVAGTGLLLLKAPLVQSGHRLVIWSSGLHAACKITNTALPPPGDLCSHEVSTSCPNEWNEVMVQALPGRNGRGRREEGLT